jgi:hypothetical protein
MCVLLNALAQFGKHLFAEVRERVEVGHTIQRRLLVGRTTTVRQNLRIPVRWARR